MRWKRLTTLFAAAALTYAVAGLACASCKHGEEASQFDLDDSPADAGTPAPDTDDASRQCPESGVIERRPCDFEEDDDRDQPSAEEIARETWTPDAQKPAELHEKAEVHSGDTFDWAPDGKEVVLHTEAESRATREVWSPMVDSLEDDWREPSEAKREHFGMVFDVPLEADKDPKLEEFRNLLTSDQTDERVFFGLGGVFARHRTHLFECGPGAGGKNAPPDGRTWQVGALVVQCRHPQKYEYQNLKLRFGIGLEFPEGWKPGFNRVGCRIQDECRTQPRMPPEYETRRYIIAVDGMPAVPGLYLDRWNELRDRVVRSWELWDHRSFRGGFERDEQWERISMPIFVQGRGGVRSRPLMSVKYYGRQNGPVTEVNISRRFWITIDPENVWGGFL